MAFNWAVTVGDVVRVVLLFYLMPAWLVLLAWRVLGERPTPHGRGAAGAGLWGVALVLVPPDGHGTAWWDTCRGPTAGPGRGLRLCR